MDLLGLEPRTCRLRVEVTHFFASPYRADGGDRTHDTWLEARHVPATPRPRRASEDRIEAGTAVRSFRAITVRSNPPLHIARGGTRRSRTCCLPGFNRSLIRMSLSSTTSRREESNLHHVVPNHACSRYTTSSRATLRAGSVASLSHGTAVQLSRNIRHAPDSGMRQHGGKGSNPHHPGWSRASWPVGRPPLAQAHRSATSRTT